MSSNKRIAFCGIFVALALVFSYLESLLPMSFAIPGIKMGLANVVTIFLIFKIGLKEAIVVGTLRVILSALLFGNIAVLIFSVSGMLLSILVMFILSKIKRVSIVGVSIWGGISHNVGQIIIAIIIMGNINITYYLPFLILSGIFFGGLMGVIAYHLIKNVEID